jgi:hypothetical protein
LEYKHTTQGLKHLEAELEHFKKSDSFRHTLRKFYQNAKKETDSLGLELKKIRKQHVELSKYYCADQGGDIGLLVHSYVFVVNLFLFFAGPPPPPTLMDSHYLTRSCNVM